MNMKRGLYDLVIDRRLDQQLERVDHDRVAVQRAKLDPGDSHAFLAQHLLGLLAASLRSVDGEQRLERQIELCNRIVELLAEQAPKAQLGKEQAIAVRAERLLAILDKPQIDREAAVERPDSPLAMACLLTGTRLDPSLVSQLRKEIASADQLDILCSFIKWSGIRILEEPLRQFTARPGARLRVITTSYMGATDLKAIDFLAGLPNTELRVSYDTHRTRLHAKAYLFHRATGFGAAYIGSANLSQAALTEGLEWTIKISQHEQAYLFDKVQATFETYWNDHEFQPYDAEQRPRLQKALQDERAGDDEAPAYFFDLAPHTYQEEILQRLEAERELQGRKRQLIVAATGTGKTVLAAFDFRRWRERRWREGNKRDFRLLFVAHREEILRQALHTFRNVLRDANFGEMLVGGETPTSHDHLFASIQSFNSKGLTEALPPEHYDYVVIDEFHHAAAPSYRQLLEHVKPMVLLGLTATPERMDGLDVFGWFDNHLSAEIRLPDAINNRHLCPFQYFGISDNVDLSGLKWQRGCYDAGELNRLYTGNDMRAGLVIDKVRQIVTDVGQARGLGFCVSVEHAHYMARKFNEAGIPSEALDGRSPDDIRHTVQQRLLRREINFIFVVDLYNEGVDIPQVDTVLFLRPTESLTIFLQQLGRGLRLADGKDCLTVLDFIGQANKNYRFDHKYRGLLTDRGRRLDREIEQGFPHLPLGCSLQMEKVAQRIVLENIRQSLRLAPGQLVKRLATFEQETGRKPTLERFLDAFDMELDDIYRRKLTWARLQVQAGLREEFQDTDEGKLTAGIRRFAHISNPGQIQRLQRLLELHDEPLSAALQDEVNHRTLMMLHFSLWGKDWLPANLEETLGRLRRNPTMLVEVRMVLDWRLGQVPSVPPALDLPFPCPLTLHGLYTRDEILAGLGHWTLESQPEMREGVKHLKDLPADLFFVTLNKTEGEFSPTTMYEDYAISENLFHWQSQNNTAGGSPAGQRYINHESLGSHVLLFVRESKKRNGLACPFYFLGPVRYESHTGSRPMSITWRLAHPLPAHLLRQTSRLAVA